MAWHGDVNDYLNNLNIFITVFVEGRGRPREFTRAYQRRLNGAIIVI